MLPASRQHLIVRYSQGCPAVSLFSRSLFHFPLAFIIPFTCLLQCKSLCFKPATESRPLQSQTTACPEKSTRRSSPGPAVPPPVDRCWSRSSPPSSLAHCSHKAPNTHELERQGHVFLQAGNTEYPHMTGGWRHWGYLCLYNTPQRNSCDAHTATSQHNTHIVTVPINWPPSFHKLIIISASLITKYSCMHSALWKATAEEFERRGHSSEPDVCL